MLKIAIHGKKNSGKNTLANLLQERFERQSLKVQQFSLAEPIKNAFNQMFTVPSEWLNGASHLRESLLPGYVNKENLPLSVRDVLMDVAKLGRSYNIDIWANKTLNNIASSKADVSIITDFRFQNEMHLFKANNFKLIKIFRASNSLSNDISEIDLDNFTDQFDYLFDNNGSLEDLKLQANKVKLLDNMAL